MLFFSEFLTINLNSALFELLYSKIYFSLTKILVLKLFKMAENQTECFRLEHRTSIKSLLIETCKPCEIYRIMCTERQILEKKIFTNGLNMGWP